MNETAIHPTAVINPRAELGSGTTIGAYATIGPGVRLGSDCRVEEHANLRGPLEAGDRNVFGPGCAIGHDPQVRGDDGPFGRTVLGSGSTFREGSQVHRSRYEEGVTRVGDDVYVMGNAHIGHDCRIEDSVTLVNGVLLAGHVEVGRGAFLGGLAAVHQFRRVGEYSMTSGMSPISQDVPPFGTVAGGRPTRLHGINRVGLRRAGFSREAIRAIATAHRRIFRGEGPVEARLAAAERDAEDGGSLSAARDEIGRLAAFVRTAEKGVIGIRSVTAGPDEG